MSKRAKRSVVEPTWKPLPYGAQQRIRRALAVDHRPAAAAIVDTLLDCLEKNYALGWLFDATGSDELIDRARVIRERLHASFESDSHA